jgi:hypothetical protein
MLKKGALEVDAFVQHSTVYAKRLTWQNWGSNPNRVVLDEFFARIRESRAPSVTWYDGFEALRVGLACYDSSDAKQLIRMERTSNCCSRFSACLRAAGFGQNRWWHESRINAVFAAQSTVSTRWWQLFGWQNTTVHHNHEFFAG